MQSQNSDFSRGKLTQKETHNKINEKYEMKAKENN